MDSRRLIPSMFHRRLLLIAATIGLVLSGLTAQIVRLSVVEGADRRAEAESRLDRRTYLPTHRGRILDRKGRILAEDRPSYDIALSYEVITGTWALERAAAQARKEIGRLQWNTLGPEARDELIAQVLPQWKERIEALWEAMERLGGIDEDEIERRRNLIRAQLQRRSAVVWEQQRQAWMRRFGEHADDDAQGEPSSTFKPRPLLEHRQPHVILPRVSDEVAFEFQKMAQAVGDDGLVHVMPSHARIQPWLELEVVLDRGPASGLPKPLQAHEGATLRLQVEGVADHLIGTMRDEVNAEELRTRPFIDETAETIDLGGYRIGDEVGSRGLEAAFESLLRGKRGMVTERRTAEGAYVQERIEPVPGDDLQVTLDIMLQARIQAILSHEYGLTRVQPWHANSPAMPIGRPLNASAVVLDVSSGEVLAMVSMPTMAMGNRISESRRLVDNPWINRAAEGVYPPGSIIKPLVLTAAVMEGVHDIHAPIQCTGHYWEHIQNAGRCWIYRDRYGLTTHGSLRAEEALARSCNIYFYTLADWLGMQKLSQWFSRFGLGSALDVGLRTGRGLGESSGQVLPSPKMLAELRRDGGVNAATVFAGIGQGPMVTWTPLQAANAYAMIARGGLVRDATLVSRDLRSQVMESAGAQRDEVRLPQHLVQAILEGLRQSVSEPHGTGYQIRYDDASIQPDRIINAPNVVVWAKTGTAQAPPLPVDTTGDGETDSSLSGLSHAWFVGLVGPSETRKPTHAIAVLVEYGGSGGRVSGPIANQIIRALQHEGYLSGANAQLAARAVH